METAEEFYDSIKNKLGTEALLSYQIDSENRIYGMDAIIYFLKQFSKSKQESECKHEFMTIPSKAEICSKCGDVEFTTSIAKEQSNE